MSLMFLELWAFLKQIQRDGLNPKEGVKVRAARDSTVRSTEMWRESVYFIIIELSSIGISR